MGGEKALEGSLEETKTQPTVERAFLKEVAEPVGGQ